MSTNDNLDEIVLRNAFINVMELARELDRPFTDEDVTDLGLAPAAIFFVSHYFGSNNFIANIRPSLKRGLTVAQCRGALNVMRTDKFGKKLEDDAVAAANAAPVQVPERPAVPTPSLDRGPDAEKCFTCKQWFSNHRDLLLHLNHDHGKNYPIRGSNTPVEGTVVRNEAPEPVTPADQPEESVIANTASTMNLDLDALPDGYYAFPHPTAMNSTWLFVMVRRTRKDKRRDRRYNFGVIRTGNEKVPAGTIEFKEWSSDSKRLFGEQRPGDVYRGEYEKQLAVIAAQPEPFALMFGQQVGRCGRCGKTLTVDSSIVLGLGPECEKYQGRWGAKD